MKENKYLTIGEFSNITGLTIKSLRYYDRIGILKPTYIDKESKYRYYTRKQTQYADIISMANVLDIPLKNISPYIKNDVIDYDFILDQAKKETNKKINKLKHSMELIDSFNEMNKRQSLCSFDEYKLFEIKKMKIIMVPFNGEINSENFYKEASKFFNTYKENELGSYWGLILIKENEVVNKYIFTEIINNIKLLNKSHIQYQIKEKSFYCKLDYNPKDIKDFSHLAIIMETFLPFNDDKTIYEIMKN